jgi:two-component system response regulator VicR
MAHILIVEDNTEIASLYLQVFSQHQTRVLCDVPEAIAYLQEARPDLVITDLHLPTRSGIEILSFIRTTSALKDIPVIGISIDDMLKWEAQERGVDVFMTKPFEVSELYNTARRLMYSVKKSPDARMQAALRDYAAAYHRVYNCFPRGQWTGTHIVIEGVPRNATWLQAEAHRLRGVAPPRPNRGYVYRLIDRLRRL